MTNTTQELWPECMIRSKVMTGAGVSCKGYGALMAERDALRSRLAEAEALLRGICAEVESIDSTVLNRVDRFLAPRYDEATIGARHADNATSRENEVQEDER